MRSTSYVVDLSRATHLNSLHSLQDALSRDANAAPTFWTVHAACVSQVEWSAASPLEGLTVTAADTTELESICAEIPFVLLRRQCAFASPIIRLAFASEREPFTNGFVEMRAESMDSMTPSGTPTSGRLHDVRAIRNDVGKSNEVRSGVNDRKVQGKSNDARRVLLDANRLRRACIRTDRLSHHPVQTASYGV